MARKGYEYVDEYRYKGEIVRRKYRFPFSDLGNFVRLGIFSVNSKKDTIEDWSLSRFYYKHTDFND